MERDIRASGLYREAQALYEAVRRPGEERVSDASELHVAPDGRHAVFAGAVFEKLEGSTPTRICEVDLGSGEIRRLTDGPGADRMPRYASDGVRIAFLSDRHKVRDFQLFLIDRASGAVISCPTIADGWIEYLHWSPDGRRILLGVAGAGADVAGAQGAITSNQVADNVPPWMPTIETGNESYRWRTAWVYDVTEDALHQVSPDGLNIWEAVWCGERTVAAVTSNAPSEGQWYNANLQLIDVESKRTRPGYVPRDQLGALSASPSGRHVAIVEAVCSDRCIVAGDLKLLDTGSGQLRRVSTRDVDVSYTEWRSEQRLLLAGHRGFETVVSLYDVASDALTELWRSTEITTAGWHAGVAGLNDSGDCVLAGEGFAHAPEIATIRSGRYRSVVCLDASFVEQAKALATVQRITWRAPDGLEIQGWLLQPTGLGPHPLVMNIHGGPVWHWRQRWLGRMGVAVLMLLRHGYAVFLPNPRGSSGRGVEFARRVVGDIGGADTYDYLSGLDELVARGIADPARLGVFGGSYGGFMTSWLITQDSRFSAAVPTAPVINHVTEHLIGNIPHFVKMFLADEYTNPAGRYFERSPVMHAHKVNASTHTLNICGALDRCTPPEEATQFHNALLENGVHSVLVTYPQEGHGVRGLPAAIDYTARVVAWFKEHLPPVAPPP